MIQIAMLLMVMAAIMILGIKAANAEGPGKNRAERGWALDLRLFEQGAGTVTHTLNGFTNAYTGVNTAYGDANGGDMTPTLKTFYDTTLLDNARPKLIFAQLGQKQPLPAHEGTTIEWRKWNTLPQFDMLTDGVIPAAKKFGMTMTTVAIAEYGEYVTVSRRLKTHALDDVVGGATEELGAAGGLTQDILVRNQLVTGTNILFGDVYDDGEYDSTPSTAAAIQTALAAGKVCNLTPDMVNKAKTNLSTLLAPPHTGKYYLAVVHPHVAYDLRKSPDWVDYHKYAAVEEIFNGEIGELHGVRFVESPLAPVIKGASDTYATYKTLFFGKNAFGIIDPEEGGMETIIHQPGEIGGPLNQFGTVGAKFETATKILYQDRMLAVWTGSSYSETDTAN